MLYKFRCFTGWPTTLDPCGAHSVKLMLDQKWVVTIKRYYLPVLISNLKPLAKKHFFLQADFNNLGR